MSKHSINRREFMGKAAAGVVATGLGLSCLNQDQPESEEKSSLTTRTLGRTRLEIPIVSFGVMNSDSPDLLRHALESGIKHMDTAHLYLRGNSERSIGKFLEETGTRDQVYLGTKMRFNRDREKNIFLLDGVERQPGATIENFEEQLDESLRRLRTNHVDILYIHSCYSPEMVLFEPLMEACAAAKKAGKARFIGISTHNNEPANIRAAVDSGIYDVVLTAYNYLMERRDEIKSAIQYAADKNVGVIAMKTQGGVQLNQEGKVEVNHKAALKWVLNDPNVCTSIPGITTMEQMELDVSVMHDLTLTEEEKRDLQLTSMLSGILFCQNCKRCLASCPQNVQIPTLMRSFMYAEGYGNLSQAQQTLEGLPGPQGLKACGNCTTCSAHCPNGIPIGTRIDSLSQVIS